MQPETIDTLVRAGEVAMSRAIPEISATFLLEFVRTGDRSKHAAASFGRRNMLMEMVPAESVEDKGRFNEAIASFKTKWDGPVQGIILNAKAPGKAGKCVI